MRLGLRAVGVLLVLGAVVASTQAVALSDTSTCSAVEVGQRIDCFPRGTASQSACEARGCCWSPPPGVSNATQVPMGASRDAVPGTFARGAAQAMGTPYCFYPNGYGYTMSDLKTGANGFTATLTKSAPPSVYGGDIPTLSLTVTFETDTRVHMKITDASAPRYEVPIDMPVVSGTPPSSSDSMDYTVTTTSNPFGLSIVRKSTGAVMWNSTMNGFTYSDQFIQWSSLLSSKYIYGLGEHVAPLLLDVNWQVLTLFARDQGTPEGYTNLYGVHPFFMNLEDDGNAHGVFLLNSNAMDIILQPTPAITYRTIGGIIDMYFVTGPTPENVIQQYNDVIGHPVMPPYWALGFHLCRWGYMTVNQTRYINDAVRAYGVPQDTQWNDIDSMRSHLDFTYDPVRFAEFPRFISDLKTKYGQHYMVITDPGISNTQPAGEYAPFDDGNKLALWVNNSNSTPFVGPVWPGPCVFPDFFNPATAAYWQDQLQTFHNLGVHTDGLWIDMNEPDLNLNNPGCEVNKWNNPPYVPNVPGLNLVTKTACLSSNQYLSKTYNLHSLYGYSETVATMNALKAVLKERPIVISRSTFAGTGYHGSHWLGDNDSAWADLYLSIPGILAMQMFGITLVGADICGFNGKTTEELCRRWMQLGAFYPFSRNHNAIHMPRQDPAAFGADFAAGARNVLLTRYRLLPFLYSLFHQAHSIGGTVARPLLFNFPQDENTYAIDKQFMWGTALLITPVLELNATTVSGYFPAGKWYDYYTGVAVSVPTGKTMTLSAPLDIIPLHIRGGSIIPAQQPAITTTVARTLPRELLLALDTSGRASGFMFDDDGTSFDTFENGEYTFAQFNASVTSSMGVLTLDYVHQGYTPTVGNTFASITVMGQPWQPSSVSVNGAASTVFSYNATTQVLLIEQLSLAVGQSSSVQWKA